MKSQKRSKVLYRYVMIVIMSLCISAYVNVAQGQSFQTGFYFTPSLPQGDYNYYAGDYGFGFSTFVGHLLEEGKIMIGMDVDILFYPDFTRIEKLGWIDTGAEVRLTTSNSSIMTHGFIRYFIDFKPLKPYIEGLVGMNILSTETFYENADDKLESPYFPYSKIVKLGGLDLSMGVGAGISFTIFDGKTEQNSNSKIAEALFDIHLRYLIGNGCQVIEKGGVRIEPPTIRHDLHDVASTVFTIQAGILFKFRNQ